MKKIIVLSIFIAFLAACGGYDNQNKNDSPALEESISADNENPGYDPNRGEGRFKNYDPGTFNVELASVGEGIYNSKCIACHKLSDEMLVGPGWAGITKKHSASWILNFLTNTDDMLDKDPELQKQLEICMVRMPNQNLIADDAKHVYAFMRKNDGAK